MAAPPKIAPATQCPPCKTSTSPSPIPPSPSSPIPPFTSSPLTSAPRPPKTIVPHRRVMLVPPPPSPLVLTTTVRRISPPFIALSTVLALFVVLTIFFFLRLIFRQSRNDFQPISTPIPQSLPRGPAQEPTVSRLALADLLGVRGSGSSLSDIDSAAPLFYVNNPPSVSSEEEPPAEDVCAVCLEPLQAGQRARRLPCHHVYHDTCAVVWLIKADRCPVCAQPVVQKEQETEQTTAVIITDRRPERSLPRARFLTSLFRVRR